MSWLFSGERHHHKARHVTVTDLRKLKYFKIIQNYISITFHIVEEIHSAMHVQIFSCSAWLRSWFRSTGPLNDTPTVLFEHTHSHTHSHIHSNTHTPALCVLDHPLFPWTSSPVSSSPHSDPLQ